MTPKWNWTGDPAFTGHPLTTEGAADALRAEHPDCTVTVVNERCIRLSSGE